MSRFKDLTGQTFGRWFVISHSHRNNLYIHFWHCICDCGKKGVIRGADLIRGSSLSCGCLCKELTTTRNLTHKLSKTTTYRTYHQMKHRCYNHKNKSFQYYGGRGIKVCDRWLESFENFLEDMGECPENMSIDRIDNNGNYEPNNCRWATNLEQMRNQRNNLYLEYNNKTLCLSEWSELTGVHIQTIRYRYHKGWSPEECLFGRKKKPVEE